MPMFDYICDHCRLETEEVVSDPKEDVPCPDCGHVMSRVWRSAPVTMNTVIPSYPGCKGNKAGYVHTHSPKRPATKIQSGYGGSQGPKN